MSFSEDQAMEEAKLRNDETEEQDPVVRTYPVFFSPGLRNNLLLNQFPLRPKNRTYSDANGEAPIDVRVKPKTGWMEVDVPIPTTKYYNEDKAMKYGNGKKPIQTQTLSGRLQKPRTNLMVGLIRDGQFHIVPLRGLTQLRPSMKHVNEYTQKLKAAAGPSNSSSGTSTPRGPIRAVQVTAKQNTEAPKVSTTHIVRATEEEEWVELDCRPERESESILKQLECPIEHQPNECAAVDEDYSFI
ncbi:DNA-directed RNA polymerase III subunit rpc5 [Schizosaccharomyces pombe]|uniref:DNA-directed RNA polymerase III subunit rpc5 n=1 Tax=Schizosaccharomyces pombe (strain 972 / ATCC 24843) TaxID=284812 RepID=RPC5_SCHPO|nr:putative DNA-directed RNA polymerase III complex subunit Rpc37 [Schizosaccharomyces pombe]O74883.1 RecName: Full=DNA-directed RNA polymerase III subunit rpc5; Short=RNA polymerase III subunit C5; AltName: Full=RNA polymerase III subunit C37 [Schizosaccharomyces pombe 972h-]CAA20918.1 DNA-directed RNA polymerase III complex subunit Rpc37 (predicted) [Schizosaccharomyces pombe]|eukprot:NP_587713.1 putative DNA-directed RNA polymerase III complex subunit Rpc37 [Schizosaccharomyces pombe]